VLVLRNGAEVVQADRERELNTRSHYQQDGDQKDELFGGLDSCQAAETVGHVGGQLDPWISEKGVDITHLILVLLTSQVETQLIVTMSDDVGQNLLVGLVPCKDIGAAAGDDLEDRVLPSSFNLELVAAAHTAPTVLRVILGHELVFLAIDRLDGKLVDIRTGGSRALHPNSVSDLDNQFGRHLFPLSVGCRAIAQME